MAANNVTPEISIHALLAESDEITHAKHRAMDISIHALLAESDGADLANAGTVG